jgi:5-formyltetrahydrofolate cyclo-ligase
MPEFVKARVVFSYYSLGREVDTVRLLQYALDAGKTVALPVCFKGGIMEARAITDLKELTRSDYGLLEPLNSERVVLPEELDFIVVPALAYDCDGYRLGWGGGYYDRYLTKTGAFRTGIGRHRLLREQLPREAHDVPVDCVVTEKRRDSKAEPRLRDRKTIKESADTFNPDFIVCRFAGQRLQQALSPQPPPQQQQRTSR